MRAIYSPNNINVLLHYHCSPEPHERIEAPAVQEAVELLLSEGAIRPDEAQGPNCYRTTPLGMAWVEALCRVTTPRAVFVDQQGRIL
jgi:hypothetical protein